MRILIVDDEPIIGLTLGPFLEKLGHDAITAESAAEALDCIESAAHPIDVLLSDVCMPETDGIRLLRQVRRAHPEVSVVLMTGFENSVGTGEAIESGACAYLRKPLKLLELEAVIDQIESHRRTRGDLRRLSETVRDEQRLREEFARDHEILLRLQRQLVPKDFSWLRSTQIFVRHLPQSGLGGDFAEIRQLDRDKTLLIVADVSGHGVSASFGGIALKTAASAITSAHSPAEALGRLEGALRTTLPDDFYATAFCGLYDEPSRRLTYSIAGHPAPVVIRPAGGAALLPGDGRALCCGATGETHEVHETVLEDADTLAVYTDGLTRTMEPLLAELTERVGPEALARKALHGVARLFLDAAVGLAPAQAFADDLSLVLLRPTLPEAPARTVSLSGRCILLCDRDPAHADTLAAVLERRGAHCPRRTDPATLIEAAEGLRPDAVITDVPDDAAHEDGVLARLRRRMPQLPVVLMANGRADETARACLTWNAAGFLRKPVRPVDLPGHVADALSLAQGGSAIRYDDVSLDWMDFLIPSDPAAVTLLQRYLESLRRQPIPGPALEDILYCIREIAGNAIEWGNRHRQERTVRISTVVLPDRVMVKVSDEGAGFNVRRALAEAGAPEAQAVRDRRGKRDGGFGLALVRTRMDRLQFNPRGNVALMTKYLRPTTDDSPSGNRMAASREDHA